MRRDGRPPATTARVPFTRRVGAWVPLFAALLALFAHTGRLAHYLVVAHTVCEHGQLVDGHDETTAHAGEAPDERARSHAEPASGPAHEDAHEHCDLAALAHGLGAPPPPIAEASLLTLDSAPLGAERAACSPKTPLALAPKASPPRG